MSRNEYEDQQLPESLDDDGSIAISGRVGPVWVLYEIGPDNKFQIHSSLASARRALTARTAELVLQGLEVTHRDESHSFFDGDDIELVIDQYEVDDHIWHDAY